MNNQSEFSESKLFSLLRRKNPSKLREAIEGEGIPPGLMPALMVKATFYKNVNAVETLLSMGGDINQRDHLGLSPLDVAVESLDGSLIEFILDKGADINGTDSNGFSPLHTAIDSEIEDVYYREDTAGKKGLMPIPLATTILLKRRADPTVRNRSGETPLGMVKRRGFTEVYKPIFEKAMKAE